MKTPIQTMHEMDLRVFVRDTENPGTHNGAVLKKAFRPCINRTSRQGRVSALRMKLHRRHC